MVADNMKRRRVSLSALTRVTGLAASQMYRMRTRKSMKCAELFTLCQSLQWNFFQNLSELLPEELHRPTQKRTALQKEVIDLKQQINQLERERDLLKDILKEKE
jgi:hypothetical protein